MLVTLLITVHGIRSLPQKQLAHLVIEVGNGPLECSVAHFSQPRND